MKKMSLVTALAIAAVFCCRPVTAEESNYSRMLVCSQAFEALGRIGDPAAEEVLLRGLKSDDFFLRASAADALGKLNDKEAIPWLEAASRDRNYLVSIFATKALVQLGVVVYEKKLFSFLSDSRPEVRAITVEQLGDFGDKYLFRVVRVLLNDNNYMVRVKAIEQLGKNRFNPALNYIKAASQDANPQVREAACSALGKINSEENTVPLNLRLDDPDIYVRAAARAALSSLPKQHQDFAKKKRKVKGKEKEGFTELLWKDTKSPSPVVRSSSYIALANLGDLRVVNVILQDITSPDSPALVKKEGARALVLLKPVVFGAVRNNLASSPNTKPLSENIELDYRVNGRWLVAVFIAALQDPNDPLHHDAPIVLKELKSDISYSFLQQALSDNDPAFRASVLNALGYYGRTGALRDIIELCRKYGF